MCFWNKATIFGNISIFLHTLIHIVTFWVWIFIWTCPLSVFILKQYHGYWWISKRSALHGDRGLLAEIWRSGSEGQGCRRLEAGGSISIRRGSVGFYPQRGTGASGTAARNQGNIPLNLSISNSEELVNSSKESHCHSEYCCITSNAATNQTQPPQNTFNSKETLSGGGLLVKAFATIEVNKVFNNC